MNKDDLESIRRETIFKQGDPQESASKELEKWAEESRSQAAVNVEKFRGLEEKLNSFKDDFKSLEERTRKLEAFKNRVIGGGGAVLVAIGLYWKFFAK